MALRRFRDPFEEEAFQDNRRCGTCANDRIERLLSTCIPIRAQLERPFLDLYRIFSAATQTEPQQATEGDHRIRN